MNDLSFSERVTFTHRLTRRVEYRESGEGIHRRRDRWKVWTADRLSTPTAGIVVGKRWLANGRTEWDYETGVQWWGSAEPNFVAYLVAFNMRRNPALVLPEHITERVGVL